MNHRQHKENRALTSQENRQTPFWASFRHQRWHACFIHENVWKRERQRWTDGTKGWETEQETRRWQRENRPGENKCLSFPEHTDWNEKKNPNQFLWHHQPREKERPWLIHTCASLTHTHRNVFITLCGDFPFLLSAWVRVCEKERYRPLPASSSGAVSGSLGRHFLGTRRTAYTAVSVSRMFWLKCLHNPLSSHLKWTNTHKNAKW